MTCRKDSQEGIEPSCYEDAASTRVLHALPTEQLGFIGGVTMIFYSKFKINQNQLSLLTI